MSELDDIVKEFLLESYENLDRLDRDLVQLEKEPSSNDLISSIFRTIHTIKGTCGFLGFGKLESVSHVGENLLSRLRDGLLILDAPITSGLLSLVDAVRQILNSIEHTGKEGDKDFTDLIDLLTILKDSGSDAPSLDAPESLVFVEASVFEAPADDVAEVKPVVADHETPVAPPAGAVDPAKDTVAAPVEASTKSAVSDSAIRVDVGLLDRLMNLVGELVLARNQIVQFTATQQEPTFVNASQRLNLITTELQEGVMKTRMQPIGTIWSKFPRIVRDLSNACGKSVRIEMDGRETELDKTIIEAIKDPLTHVIRNSIDHGIEPVATRVKNGKAEEGCLRLRAYHEGGQVNIEITDDGGGINCDKVKAKAIEKNLITSDQASRMSDREAVNLIFLPGFSTAEKITNVSGRGVGMDVVKTNIERIGGTVDVQTALGKGTTLKIKIPLTLAIIPALIVTCGAEHFAIPQVSLLELVRLDEKSSGIEMINGTALYRLRGNLLPLVYLNRELKLNESNQSEHVSSDEQPAAANIVVLRGGDRQFGLVVDHINDTEEIVVKPLSKQLKGLSVFAGATIMGDGKVALILDVMGVAHAANLMSQAAENRAITNADQNASRVNDKRTLLLFRLEDEERMAVPLSEVARLEEFERSEVEDAGEQLVVQYRGKIMPLINLAERLGDRRAKARMRRTKKETEQTSKIQVVVYTHLGRNVGLLVDRILDVVDEVVILESTASRPGVLGTAIIKEKVTELLDVSFIVQTAIDPIPNAGAARPGGSKIGSFSQLSNAA